MLHLEVASTVQCTTPKTKEEKEATKDARVHDTKVHKRGNTI